MHYELLQTAEAKLRASQSAPKYATRKPGCGRRQVTLTDLEPGRVTVVVCTARTLADGGYYWQPWSDAWTNALHTDTPAMDRATLGSRAAFIVGVHI